jgi:hypothetical protein
MTALETNDTEGGFASLQLLVTSENPEALLLWATDLWLNSMMQLQVVAP